MVSKDFVIKNKMGCHMRPAQVFVNAMAKYPCDVTIKFGGKDINAKSIMMIMAACIKVGSEITVTANGEEEAAALAQAAEMIESGFGEE